MSDLTEEDLSPRTYTPGEIVEGEVVRVDEEGIVVSVGLKMEGMVPLLLGNGRVLFGPALLWVQWGYPVVAAPTQN